LHERCAHVTWQPLKKGSSFCIYHGMPGYTTGINKLRLSFTWYVGCSPPDTSFQGDFDRASSSVAIRLKTVKCLPKQMRVNPPLKGIAVCTAGNWTSNVSVSLNTAAKHLLANAAQRLMQSWCCVRCSCGQGALTCSNEMFMRQATGVRVNACSRKCYSRQTIRRRLLSRSLLSRREGRSKSGVLGFKIFMNLWIPLKDYNLSFISWCHTALGRFGAACINVFSAVSGK